jgi:hypothetical protein
MRLFLDQLLRMLRLHANLHATFAIKIQTLRDEIPQQDCDVFLCSFVSLD